MSHLFRRIPLFLGLSIFFALLGAGTQSEVWAVTITVTNNNDTGAGSLRQAIADAASGDTIDFDADYTITLGSELSIDKDLTIAGRGAGSTIIQASAAPDTASWRVFNITAGTSTLEDMTIRYGKDSSANHGGGIHNRGTLTVNNVVITNNTTAGNGGGIYCYQNAVLIINDSTITDNESSTTTGGGGGIYCALNAVLTINDSTIANNTQTEESWDCGGGGIFCNGADLTINRCTISGNSAIIGAGIRNSGNAGTLAITDSTISGNVSDDFGGGIYVNTSHEEPLTITNSTISGNTSGVSNGYGAGMQMDNGTVTISNCTIANNSTDDTTNGCGGVYLENGSLTVKNTILANNTVAGSDKDYRYVGGTLTDGGYNVVEYQNLSSIDANNGMAFNDITDILFNTKVDENTTEHEHWNQSGSDLGGSPNLSLSSTLYNNGGPTQTLALCKTGDTDAGCAGTTQNSFAIDAIHSDSGQCGGSAPYNIDQRGIDRPYNSACDIGAYERTDSTLVELTSFTAEGFQDRVVLTWETASEIDHAGFHLWRSTNMAGQYARITDALIPCEGTPSWGAVYNYEDLEIVPGLTFFYKLESIDNAGISWFDGPVSAWAGVVDIQVNGSDGPTIIPTDQPVSVKVNVRPEEGMTDPHEWWLCCDTPFGRFSYVHPQGWIEGIQPVWVHPQVPIQDMELLNVPLPPGDYRFHFALDSRVDSRAPAPLRTPQAQPLDRMFLNSNHTGPKGFQQTTRWETAVPNWHDSIEIRVE